MHLHVSLHMMLKIETFNQFKMMLNTFTEVTEKDSGKLKKKTENKILKENQFNDRINENTTMALVLKSSSANQSCLCCSSTSPVCQNRLYKRFIIIIIIIIIPRMGEEGCCCPCAARALSISTSFSLLAR